MWVRAERCDGYQRPLDQQSFLEEAGTNDLIADTEGRCGGESWRWRAFLLLTRRNISFLLGGGRVCTRMWRCGAWTRVGESNGTGVKAERKWLCVNRLVTD